MIQWSLCGNKVHDGINETATDSSEHVAMGATQNIRKPWRSQPNKGKREQMKARKEIEEQWELEEEEKFREPSEFERRTREIKQIHRAEIQPNDTSRCEEKLQTAFCLLASPCSSLIPLACYSIIIAWKTIPAELASNSARILRILENKHRRCFQHPRAFQVQHIQHPSSSLENHWFGASRSSRNIASNHVGSPARPLESETLCQPPCFGSMKCLIPSTVKPFLCW